MSSSEWIKIEAEEFCGKVTDGTHDSPKRKEKGRYLITSKHIKGRNIDFDNAYLISEEDYEKINQRSKVDQWDVLISMIGEYCGFCYIEREKIINYAVKNVGIFKAGNKLKAEWLYYYLQSDEGKNVLISLRSGTSQPYISLGALRKLPIRINNNEKYMKNIVSTLSSLDDIVELNNRINKKLEDMAQVIFRSWFVDFEPFHDGGFEDSELGRIPKGWRVRELDELVEIINGYSYKGSELKESSDALLTIKNFDRNGGFKIDGFKEMEISERVKERHYVNTFDVLIACTDLTQNAEIIGNPILIYTKSKYNKLVASMDLVKTVSKSSYISNYFLYTLLRNENFKQFALGYTSGTTVLHLDKKGILQYKVALPSDMQIFMDFSDIIEPLYKLIGEKINESENLISIRDTLLPKLISGEIRVPVEEVQ